MVVAAAAASLHGDEEREERERCQREEDETAGEEDETAGEEEEEEEEVAGTTATCTEDERHAAGSVSTMYAENCHCSRGNLTTTDDDDEIQQYFIVDHTQQQHHVPAAAAPQRSVSRRPSVSSGASRRSTPRSRRGTMTPMSCCSHHSQPPGVAPVASYPHHNHHPQRFTDPESPAAVSRRTDSGSNATISNFNINPARFQCSYYTADESENSYCSISGENIRQIQAQTAIQHRLDREEQKQRLVPLPLQPPDQPTAALVTDTDSQQDVASLNESILSTGVESTSSDQRGPADGGSTTTTTSTTTTSTTQRQLLHQVGPGAGGGSGGRGTPKSAGSQLVLTPSKITIENIGQLSELGRTESYEFDDLDINIPEIFQSPSKIKWSFLAHLDESKSNKSRISSVSSLVDAASSGRGRSGTESGGADVSETASDNEYSPNRIRRRRPEPLPSEAVGGGPSSAQQPGVGIQASSSSCKIEELLKKSSPSASSDFKTVSIWRAENGDEGNAIIFHHESEIVENCCTNHFLDHSNYDVCRVDNCDYLIRSSDTDTGSKRASCGTLCKSEERLNNAIAPSASLAKQLELKQRNVFTTTGPMSAGAATTPTLAAAGVTAPTATTVYSIISPDLKRFEKQTNLNRHSVNLSQNLPASPTSSSSTSSIFAGNYAGSSSVYRNINHHQEATSADYDKLLNTTSAGTLSRGAGSSSRSRINTAPGSTGSRSATSTLRRLTTPAGSSTTFNNQTTAGPHSNNYYDDGTRTLSTASLRGPPPPPPPLHDTVVVTGAPEPGDPAVPPFSISAGAETAAAAAASQFYNKSYHYNLTAQNQLYFQAFSNAVREQEQQNCEFHQQQPQTPSPQPQPSCPQCYEYYGCQAQYYANATNEADSDAGPGGGVMRRRGGWRRNVGTTLRINGLVRVVRTRARKCADYIRQKEHQSNNRFRRRK
ncbi:serine-rich adhesin for platelets-like [Anopheles bellator]|uniref:serine-rich adhesin for platelets-like n=1 Tax=Anopheles bellator TaxID=139047 RepID=UPI002648EB07|nr:serine-rich adhesin for platelets-like [Anopheles bellator]